MEVGKPLLILASEIEVEKKVWKTNYNYKNMLKEYKI